MGQFSGSTRDLNPLHPSSGRLLPKLKLGSAKRRTYCGAAPRTIAQRQALAAVIPVAPSQPQGVPGKTGRLRAPFGIPFWNLSRI